MKLKAVYIVTAAVFIAALAAALIIFLSPKKDQVKIVSGGEVLYTFDLSAAEDQTIRVEYGGGYNIVEIKDGEIRVVEASCPDKVCINHGALNSRAPIVCLPNKLVIEFYDKDEIDAVAE